jgi:hypothetical protein
LLINLLSFNQISSISIAIVLFNLAVNFFLFYLLFQLIHSLTEKNKQIEELNDEINRLKTPKEEKEEQEEETFNPSEIAQQIIPSSPQNLTVSDFCEKILVGISNTCQLVSGIFYVKQAGTNTYIPCAKYAYYSTEVIEPVEEGEGIVGQVIKDKKPKAFDNIPSGYMRVVSGLGESSPRYLYIFPILNKDDVVAAVELAAFVPFDEKQRQILEQLSQLLGKIILKLKQ